jgi:RNA polymerase sigma factor (sigma-70 family)
LVALGERTIPSGQELLAEFIQYGHQEPFEEIVRRYAGMVFNVCYRITKDKHEAEDATQAVFLTLALQAKRGADIKALGPWLQQVAKRLALDTRRSKKRRQTREERHQLEQTSRRESLLDDALPSADLDELKTVLHEELQKLPAKYRLPLILHYFGGLSREEMAAELNCKPSTLGVRIFRGREMLAGRLSSRGIHISGAMLATLLGYCVKRAVSETLIASTSHAATAMLAGHDGAGFASAHVIGLTRRATGALVIGKVRIAAMSILLAGTSLGAGAKALGVLPQIDVQRLITTQLERLVRPLLQPFHPSFRVDAQSKPAAITVAAAPPSIPAISSVDLAKLIATTNPPAQVIAKPAVQIDPSAANAGGIVISMSAGPSQSTWTQSTASANRGSDSTATSAPIAGDRSSAVSSKSIDDADTVSASTASGGGGGAGGADGGIAADDRAPDAVPARSSVDNSLRFSSVAITVNDLYVGSPAASAKASGSIATSSNPTASPASLIQIPAIGGTVIESSTGEVKGYGIVNRTGTLQMNGKVVADGQGVDRTLNLASFTAVQTSAATPPVATDAVATPSAAGAAPAGASIAMASVDPSAAFSSTLSNGLTTSTAATASSDQCSVTTSKTTSAVQSDSDNDSASATSSPRQRQDGWYAIHHGRLTLPLFASSTSPSTLTWGDDPDAPTLTLVNSVRLALQTDGAAAATAVDPTQTRLSLLATDRSDAPDLVQISGATIGLWQVDSPTGSLPATDLTVCYDSVLADDLGASPSSVELWTYGTTTDTWQPVDASSFALDTTDHLVSGSASDFSYIAVSVDPSPGHNPQDLAASDLVEVSVQAPNNIQSVPEPVGLSLIIASTALLGRRRRSR